MTGAWSEPGATANGFGSQSFADAAEHRKGSALSNGLNELKWGWQSSTNPADRRSFLASLGQAQQQRFNTAEVRIILQAQPVLWK